MPLTSAASVASVKNNIATYPNVIPGIDVQYTYLPHKVKEEIIIKDKAIFTPFSNDLNLDFTLNPHGKAATVVNNLLKVGDLYITDLIAYDQQGSTINIPLSLIGNTLRLTIPIAWLKNESTQYPIIIDPTIQTNLSIAADLHTQFAITLAPQRYLRRDSPNLFVGYENLALQSRSRYRSTIEWNLQSIPDAASILNLNMTLTINTLGDARNWNISATSMEGNSSYYPDNSTICWGNCHYFADMGNGTNYTITRYDTGGVHYYNLSNATSDFQQALMNDVFNIGLYSIDDDLDPLTPTVAVRKYLSSETANSWERPLLTVTYSVSGANETDGDDAITQGILNALPAATIHPEQQVYTRSSSGTQHLGRFDRVAVFNNQRWAINYITTGESFTNMNNISTNFYVLELTDLFSSDITAQVEQFINNTKT